MSYPWIDVLAENEAEWHQALPDGVKLDIKKEIRFLNALLLEDIRLQAAASDEAAIKSVFLHQARTGLTLDPGISHAYVGLRDDRLLFMPSYRGLTEIGIQEKLILSCTAELVHKTDQFVWINGITSPDHVVKHPFGTAEEKGPIAGGFCSTKRSDGEFIVTKMSIEELDDVRQYALSVSDNPEGSPWSDRAGTRIWGMYKKTLQRRNVENWAFGNNPRMVAALSYATPDQLDNQIERAQSGVSPVSVPTTETKSISVEPTSSATIDIGDVKVRIDKLAANAEKYNVWSTYKTSVKESYGKNVNALNYALSLIPDASETPGATAPGASS